MPARPPEPKDSATGFQEGLQAHQNARFDAHRFCVVFPNTDEAQARQVLRRIAAVINNTTLEIPALEAPIGVHVATGCASRVGDETPAALTDRAKADLSD